MVFDDFNNTANQYLDVFTHPYVLPALRLFLILYAAIIVPTLPSNVSWLFDNFAFRIVILALILWTGNQDASTSVTVAMLFVMVINLMNKKSLFERFRTFERFEGPKTAILPTCLNYTVFDLLESFQNDKNALLQACLVSRVPSNVKVTDEFAPLIATYLINYGFKLKAPCGPPA